MNSLHDLNSYTAGQFEDWLRNRLIDLHSPDSDSDPDLRRQAVDFRAFGIDRGESYFDDIVALTRRLDPSAQRNFHVAIEQLLDNARPGAFPVDAMTDLICIAGDVHAVNALAKVGHLAGSSPWGELKPSLVYDALAAMMQFETAPQIHASVRALATAQYFQDKFAIDAYRLLIRCRPENWLDDLILLEGRMSRYQQYIDASGNKKNIAKLATKTLSLAVELSRAVPLSILGLQLATIDFAMRACAKLMHYLFGSTGPLVLREKQSRWFVEDRSDPARCAPVEYDDPTLWNRFQSFCLGNGLVAIPLDKGWGDEGPSAHITITGYRTADSGARLGEVSRDEESLDEGRSRESAMQFTIASYLTADPGARLGEVARDGESPDDRRSRESAIQFLKLYKAACQPRMQPHG